MGRVLKSPDGRRIPAVVDEASQRAAELLDRASTEASAIVMRAEERASETERAATERAESIEEQARVETVLALRSLRTRAAEELDATLAARERELVQLAIGVGEKLAARAFASDPTLVTGWVRDAMAKLPRATAFCVRAHEDDVPHVREAFPDFEVTTDARLGRGDVVVESDVGRVDARIAVRLAPIRVALGLDS